MGEGCQGVPNGVDMIHVKGTHVQANETQVVKWSSRQVVNFSYHKRQQWNIVGLPSGI